MNKGVINFNGGEFSPKIDCRTDTEKYVSGCRRLENMIPIVYGGAEKRPGTQLIYTTGTTSSSENLNTILSSIISYENTDVCYEGEVVVTDFNTLLSQIVCHEESAVCWEEEVVTTSATMSYLSRIICHEGEIVFYENDLVRS